MFVCQNNQYAISTPVEEQTGSSTFAQKAVAHGIPGVRVDGNDVLAVHVTAREAVARARAGDGPTLIECVTYRLSVHTTADDPSKYRDEDEVEEWGERDPIDRLRRFVADRGVGDDDVSTIEQEVDERLEAAWSETEERMGELVGPAGMFEHVYAQMPPYLERQRRSAAGEPSGGAERDERGEGERGEERSEAPDGDEEDGG